jgi:predicted dehydrogenase/threonine dehydrogenase-like Zn-dependent dehydrogenase
LAVKQLLQRLDSGETVLEDVPVPSVSGPQLLVETRATVVSAGTERMLVEFGRSNLLQKARSQPEKVRQVVAKMRTDGVGPTLDAVRAKLAAPIPLGYCQAGIVAEVGARAGAFKPGDRVVTNGSHAEYVRVPCTLAAKIPDGVSFEQAAFTPMAAIGLQGVRLAEPTLGETVVVIGLGLIGLLTVQLLQANGCRVIGIDRDPERVRLGRTLGATTFEASDQAVEQVMTLTGGAGADAVLLTLASSSDEPIRNAARMSRKRGRIVLVGVTGLDLVRQDFYEKELSFVVSCSYGPGRYDPDFEERGNDYPLAFVRWTEQRNFDAVLALMADGRLDPMPLVTHRFPFHEAPKAYDLISGSDPSLGVLLSYSTGARDAAAPRTIELRPAHPAGAAVTAGVIGAGNFATRTLLPALAREGVRLRVIASGGGTSGTAAGKAFGFERTTTDIDQVLDDPAVNTVFILTRHDSHARLARRALEAGKHVFVEKPLALSEEDLNAVLGSARTAGRHLMVGFNRRFAPLTAQVADHLRGRAGPLAIIATVNAGRIPADHWTQDPEAGGGRIVGEACHWMDLSRALVGTEIDDLSVVTARDGQGRPIDDIAQISLRFADGSIAAVHYLANGANSFPKERIECFWDGKTVVIDNWRKLDGYGVPDPWFKRRARIDKGHDAEIAALMAAIRDGGDPPIPLHEIGEVSRWAIRAATAAWHPDTSTS